MSTWWLVVKATVVVMTKMVDDGDYSENDRERMVQGGRRLFY